MSSDPFGRYYTDNTVSEAAIASIDMQSPSTVLDLACGDGSLSLAARARWQSARLVGVDIHPPKREPVGKFILDDALSDAIGRRIGGPADVAVCNPPFTHPKWTLKHQRLLNKVGLTESDAAICETGSVSLFLAQNLRLLAPNGQLAIIVPDTIVTGQKTTALRRWLLTSFQVNQVIQLPRTFHGTEAQTHLLRITKTPPAPRHCVSVSKLEKNGTLRPSIRIRCERFSRLDYEFIRSQSAGVTISELGGLVVRGAMNSRQARESPSIIFHTRTFVPGKTAVTLGPSPSTDPTAKQGDILIGRVGRNIDEKVAVVRHGSGDISDCILRLRLPREHREPVLNYLTSKAGRAAIRGAVRGVAAQYLTPDALLNIAIPRSAFD